MSRFVEDHIGSGITDPVHSHMPAFSFVPLSISRFLSELMPVFAFATLYSFDIQLMILFITEVDLRVHVCSYD